MSATDETPVPDSAEALRQLLTDRLRPPADAPRTSPLSFAQQRLWFLDQVEPDSPLYNMQGVTRFVGALNLPALEQALNRVVARHESLRTRFAANDGQPVQVIDDSVSLGLPLEDLSELSAADRETALERLIEEEMNRPFHLAADRLLRAKLAKLAGDEHVLIVTMHHIVSDEWSFRVFHREWTHYYSGLVEGNLEELPELPIQYSDYVYWQRQWLQGEVLEEQLGFWKELLSGHPPGVELPTDHPRRPEPSPRGALAWRGVDQALTTKLKDLARDEGATLFMVLLAAFKTLLHRYTRQDDIIVGSAVAGRNQVETEDLIGFFVNTLPLRSRIRGTMPFREFLAQVREMALAAYSHQEVPFDKVVEALQPERSVNSIPFLKVMFLIQHGQRGEAELPGLKIEFLEPGVGPAKFDLTLAVHEHQPEMTVMAQYSPDLFEAATVERFLGHYTMLLQQIVECPSRSLAELPLMDQDERRQLLVEWNQTRREYPRDACVHELFEEQARRQPRAVAVEFGGAKLSYQALNQRANRLARRLQRAGVAPGTMVGFGAERSLEMVVGLLAILKAGAAYAPLDPSLPAQRLQEMLADLNSPVLLLTRAGLSERLPDDGEGNGGPLPCICLDTERTSLRQESDANLELPAAADQTAYVSFTSGSTGRPKGVCVPHRSMVRLVRGADYLHFAPTEVFLQLAPLAFDASTFEIWGCLLNGARLVVFPPHTPSLAELTDLMQRHRITTAWFTSGLFHQIVDGAPEILKGLRQVIVGGDVLSPPHVERALPWLSSGVLLNGYGPTENGTFTTFYRIPTPFDVSRSVPIGKPLANTRCYVLDDLLQLVPIGVPGELHTGGDGLSSGYLNAPELTQEKFVANPFVSGERLYKTGDLVRYRADGNLEFLGRTNNQVKVRGFRVELGEIESALLAHPRVRQCVVIARPDAAGTKQLIAYIVPRDQPAPTAQVLQQLLRQRLPEYMIPPFIVALDELPLTANGKIDRQALPEPESRSALTAAMTEPRDEIERRLRAIWEEVLAVRPIGIHDKFFSLGGHSLLAVRLLSLVAKVFDRNLKVSVLFQNPTIAGLATVLRGGAESATGSSIVEIQPDGCKVPLMLVHGAGGGMFWGYSNLARHLGPDQPVFAFKSRGLEGREELDNIEALADAYLADLRVFQPRGPYCLGGYCFGGVVAYEMACRLHRQHEQVAFVGLINSTAPNSSYSHFAWTPRTALKFARNVALKTYYSVKTHPEKLPQTLRWQAQTVAKRLACAIRQEPCCDGDIRPHEWMDASHYSEDQTRVWKKHLEALRSYQPPAYPGRVTLFRSPVHLLRCSFDPQYGWGEVAQGGVTQQVIASVHETIMEEPDVQHLATAVTQQLASALGNG